MRPLREDERDEIESVKHLIKYVLTKPNIEPFKVWEAVLQLDSIAKKYVLSNIIKEEELNELSVLTQLNISNMDFLSGNTQEIRPPDIWHNYEKEIKQIQELINTFEWD